MFTFRKKEYLGLIARCKDEYFVKEFCDYYLTQGVDKIIIIDDDSVDKSIYDELFEYPKVEIDYQKDIITNQYVSKIYPSLRKRFTWLIYVDVDEFITTRKHPEQTIRDAIEDTFSEVDCIKVPWVMMSSNNIEMSPSSILKSNTHRWNHDKKHPHIIHKFRCRYEQIEVKCIFKTESFEKISDHHPITKKPANKDVVDSIECKSSALDPWYDNLRESDIASGYLLCYHYRIISRENSLNKLQTNYWYIEHGYTIDDLMSCDYNEVIDLTFAEKVSEQ